MDVDLLGVGDRLTATGVRMAEPVDDWLGEAPTLRVCESEGFRLDVCVGVDDDELCSIRQLLFSCRARERLRRVDDQPRRAASSRSVDALEESCGKALLRSTVLPTTEYTAARARSESAASIILFIL